MKSEFSKIILSAIAVLLIVINYNCNTQTADPIRFCFTPSVDDIEPYWVNSKGKYHQNGDTLTVSFFGDQSDIDYTTPHVELLDSLIGLKLLIVEPNDQSAYIRVTFDPRQGAYSYVGTDNSRIRGRNTMNLGFRSRDGGTVYHEFLHALNFLHEHQSPSRTDRDGYDEQAVYDDVGGPPNNWSKDQIDHNILDQHTTHTVDASDVLYVNSIMHYEQPCSWLKNPVSGQNCEVNNWQLHVSDIERLQEVYPILEIDTGSDESDDEPVAVECPSITFDALCEMMKGCSGWNFNLQQLIQISEALDLTDWEPNPTYTYDSKQRLFVQINREMSERGCYTCFF